VLFAEPDRTSPAAVAANLPADPKYQSVRSQLASLPDPDTEFAAALARSPSVVAFAYSDDAALSADPAIEFPIRIQHYRHGRESYVAGKVQGAQYAILPLPAFMQAAHGHGRSACRRSGPRRRHPARTPGGGGRRPALSHACRDALRVGIGGQTAQVRLTKAGFIDRMRIGEAIIPVNDRGELLLYDTGLVSGAMSRWAICSTPASMQAASPVIWS
jgi:adenylate cyclase